MYDDILELTLGRKLYTLAVCTVLGSCSTVVPNFDVPYKQISATENIPTATSIVNKVQCELIDIAGPDGNLLDKIIIANQDLQAVVELSLTVTKDGKLAPTFTGTSGVFSFGSGFVYEQSREQNFTTYLVYSLSELKKLRNGPQCLTPPDTNLAGDLGIRQMFQLFDSSGPASKWDEKGNYGVFGGSVTFTVDKELSATGPTWKLTTFSGPGSFASAYDKNVDRLTFGFVKGPNAGKALARQEAFNVIESIKQGQIQSSLQIIANNR